MFIEGLLKLYVERPDLFWPLLYGITPAFAAGLVFGLLEYSRHICGKRNGGWRWFRFIAIVDALTVGLLCYMWSWFPIDDLLLLVIGLAFTALLAAFPIFGGMLAGMNLMAACWNLRQRCYEFRNRPS